MGIEHVDDVQGRPKKQLTGVTTALASRLVVLAGGAFGSPAILERYFRILRISKRLAHNEMQGLGSATARS